MAIGLFVFARQERAPTNLSLILLNNALDTLPINDTHMADLPLSLLLKCPAHMQSK